MKQIRLGLDGCNRFLASRRRMMNRSEQGVRVVGGFVRRVATLTVLTLSIACTTEPAERVREIESLSRRRAPTTAETVRRYLADPDRNVRASALHLLDLVEGPEA